MTTVCGLDFGSLRFGAWQARRARRPQISQAPALLGSFVPQRRLQPLAALLVFPVFSQQAFKNHVFKHRVGQLRL